MQAESWTAKHGAHGNSLRVQKGKNKWVEEEEEIKMTKEDKGTEWYQWSLKSIFHLFRLAW